VLLCESESLNGFVDVLNLLRPKIIKLERERLSHLAVRVARDAHSSRLGDALQASRDVDPIPQEVATPNHHVADMDADAETKRIVWVHPDVQVTKRSLDLQSTLDGIHRARELSQDAIARRIGDPAAVLANQAVHDLAAGREGAKSPDLVLPHEARVPGYISSKDGCQPSLHPIRSLRHALLPNVLLL
jgi:hypothetical protein